jgi:hypothetical protein
MTAPADSAPGVRVLGERQREGKGAMTGKIFSEMVEADPGKFDSMDCRPGPSNLHPDYSDSLMPEHMRERVTAARRARRAPKP